MSRLALALLRAVVMTVESATKAGWEARTRASSSRANTRGRGSIPRVAYRLALALLLAASPLAAQVHSDVRIPVAKREQPAVVTVVQVDTVTLFAVDTAYVLTTLDSTVVDTLVLTQPIRPASFPWWLGLVGAVAVVGARLGTEHNRTAPADTLAPPVTVTPEPGTFGLFAGGLVVLAGLRERSASEASGERID